MFTNLLKRIIIIFFLFFHTGINAENSGCAVKNSEQIKELSFEICKKDESFRILYEMFPNFFDDILFNLSEFGEIEELKQEPEIILNNQYRKYSNLMYEVFGSLTILITYLIVFYVFYIFFFTMLKNAESGSFLDYNNQNILKTISYSGITIFMLLPFGNLIAAQIIILTIAILGISIANYIYGYYLSSLQNSEEPIELKDEYIEKQLLVGNYTNNVSINAAKAYVSQLTKIAMCRNASSQLLLERETYDINSDNYEQKKLCTRGNENLQNIDSEKYPDFFHYGYNEVYASNNSLNQLSTIKFAVDKTEERSCKKEVFKEYQCGILISQTPKVTTNRLISLYGIENFYNSIISNSKALSINGGNQEIIERGWKNIKEDIVSKINLISSKNVTPINSSQREIEEYNIATELLNKRDLIELKKMSYVYHQAMLNAVTSGLIFKTENIERGGISTLYSYITNSSFSINSKTNSAFEKDWKAANELAKKIEENHCKLTSSDLYSTFNLEKKLQNKRINGELSVRCFDFDNKKAFGMEGNEPYEEKKARKEAKDNIDNIVIEFNTIVKNVAKRRMEVELAFLNSIKELSDNNILTDLRQRGWLTMPTYIMEISRNVKVNNLYFKSLTGSNHFKSLNIENNMLESSLTVDVETADLSRKFPSYIDLSNPFKYFNLGKKPDSIYINNATFTESLLQDGQENLFKDDETIESLLNQLTKSPIKPLKQAIGLDKVDTMGRVGEGSEEEKTLKDIIEKCGEDFEYCPMPKKDPLVELNRYGHYLISTSVNYYATIIGMKSLITIGKATKAKEKSARIENKDLNSSLKGSFYESSSKIGGENSVASIALSKMADLLDITADILSSLGTLVLLMLFIGVLLAYILPLIPLIYYIVGFLSWLLLVIQILFIAPIWAVYFIKYQENKEVIHNAAKTYGLQIILKPALMVVGLIFAWELIKISLFFLNMTISPLMETLSFESGGLFGFIQEGIFLLVYSVMIFIIIKYVLDILTTLSDVLLNMLGVSSSQDMDFTASSNQILQYYLVDKGMELKDEIDRKIQMKDGLSYKTNKLYRDENGNIRQEEIDLKQKAIDLAADGVIEMDKSLYYTKNVISGLSKDFINGEKNTYNEIKKDISEKIEKPMTKIEKMMENIGLKELTINSMIDKINELNSTPNTENLNEIKDLKEKINEKIINGESEFKFNNNIQELSYIELENEEMGAIINSDGKLILYYTDGNGNIVSTMNTSTTQEELKSLMKEMIDNGDNELHLNENGEENV